MAFQWVGKPLAVSEDSAEALAGATGPLVTWTERLAPVVLSTAAKTKLATALSLASVTGLKEARCDWLVEGETRALHCHGAGTQTLTEAQYVAALADGSAKDYLERGEAGVVAPITFRDDDASATDWQAFSEEVWPAVDWTTILLWYCSIRDGSLCCEADQVVSGTYAEYLDAGGGQPGGPHLNAISP